MSLSREATDTGAFHDASTREGIAFLMIPHSSKALSGRLARGGWVGFPRRYKAAVGQALPAAIFLPVGHAIPCAVQKGQN